MLRSLLLWALVLLVAETSGARESPVVTVVHTESGLFEAATFVRLDLVGNGFESRVVLGEAVARAARREEGAGSGSALVLLTPVGRAGVEATVCARPARSPRPSGGPSLASSSTATPSPAVSQGAMSEPGSAPLDEVPSTDFQGLRALFLNCTLKRTPELSHTQGLIDVSAAILEKSGVAVSVLRPVDYEIAPGVYPDMREHGWERDDWPSIQERVMEADILVITTPIWLGEQSSVCRRVTERLYGSSGELNEEGQYAYYGRVAGCLVTGNEDGVKHCAMNLLYSLQHLGYLIPPQADAGWVGEIGPGPSYLDEGSGGAQNDFTQRNVTFMTWNLMHMARMLKAQGGIPPHGNQRSLWEAGCRFDHPNPEHR